jgi:hypothetical protein
MFFRITAVWKAAEPPGPSVSNSSKVLLPDCVKRAWPLAKGLLQKVKLVNSQEGIESRSPAMLLPAVKSVMVSVEVSPGPDQTWKKSESAPPGEGVVAQSARQVVVPGTAADDVVAVVAVKQIVAVATVHDVIA